MQRAVWTVDSVIKSLAALATACFIAVLGGCGGSGGGGDSGATGSPPGLSPNDIGTATELDASMGLPTGLPDIGMASNGDAIVVWTRVEAGRLRVYARRYTSQGWGGAAAIDAADTATKSAYHVVIEMNPVGQAVVAWVQEDSAAATLDRGSIWTRSFDPVGGWGTPEALTAVTNTQSVIGAPGVAVAADGTARVIWSRHQGTFSTLGGTSYYDTSVFTRHRGAGQVSWDSEEVLDNVVTPKYAARVLIDNAGNATAYWTRWVASTAPNRVFNLEVRVRVSSVWLSNFTVATNVVAEDGDLLAGTTGGATVSDGRFALTWDTADATLDDNVSYARVFQNGAWNPTTEIGVGWAPAIAAGGGRAVVTRSALMPSNDLYVAGVRTFTPAGGWGALTYLDDMAALTYQGFVGMNTAGRATSVWSRLDSQTGALLRPYANYFDGTGWQAASRRLAGTADGDVLWAIKLDDNGNAIALWQRQTGISNMALWANRFRFQ